MLQEVICLKQRFKKGRSWDETTEVGQDHLEEVLKGKRKDLDFMMQEEW